MIELRGGFVSKFSFLSTDLGVRRLKMIVVSFGYQYSVMIQRPLP